MYYRNAESVAKEGVNITALNMRFFEQTVEHAIRTGYHPTSIEATRRIQNLVSAGSNFLIEEAEDRVSLAQLLVGQGDGAMLRVKHHISTLGLHMAEQIDRNTGGSVSAVDLTWSDGKAVAECKKLCDVLIMALAFFS